MISFAQDNETVPLSPIKSAAYERAMRQNSELVSYIAKVNEEKTELLSSLRNFEEQVSQYRYKEKTGEQVRLLFLPLPFHSLFFL